MSDDDSDKLPFGLSPFKASERYISPCDDRQTAISKSMLYEMQEQARRNEAFQREFVDAAREGSSPASFQAGPATYVKVDRPATAVPAPQPAPAPHAAPTRHPRNPSEFFDSLVGDKHEDHANRTGRLALGAKIAWAAAAGLLLVVVLGIKLPWVPYTWATSEYLAVRGALVLAVLCGYWFTKAARRNS